MKIEVSPHAINYFKTFKSNQMTYYYISNNLGMTSSGSFTKDKNRWITFTQNEVSSIDNNKPYGATKKGIFISTEKF